MTASQLSTKLEARQPDGTPWHGAHCGKSDPLVMVVIVNYNCANDTKLCLLSLEKLRGGNVHVVVIDNHSTTDDLENLQRFVMRRGHAFFAIPENQGFAAANNIGIHYARAAEAKYVWLLNPDTVVEPGSAAALIECCEKSARPMVCGSKILYGSLDGQEAFRESQEYSPRGGRIWSAGGTVDFYNQQVSMLGWNTADEAGPAEPRACDYLPGCSMFVPLSVIDAVGDLPEEFFLYFEETEWCTRMRAQDIELVCVPTSVVWHRFDDEKMQSTRTIYYYNRNQLAFWYRHSGWKKKAKMIFQLLTKKLPELQRAIRQAPNEEQRSVFFAHRSACLDFLRGRMGRQSL